MPCPLASVTAGIQHGGAIPVLLESPAPPVPNTSPPAPPAAWSGSVPDPRLVDLENLFVGEFEPLATPGRTFLRWGRLQYRGGLALHCHPGAVQLAHGCQVDMIVSSGLILVATRSPVTGWFTQAGMILPHKMVVGTVDGVRDELVLVCGPDAVMRRHVDKCSHLSTLDATMTPFLRLKTKEDDVQGWLKDLGSAALEGPVGVDGGADSAALVGALRPNICLRIDSGRVALNSNGGAGGENQHRHRQPPHVVYRLVAHAATAQPCHVERRFSEFETFHMKAVHACAQHNLMPQLPPKTFWPVSSLEPEFIMDRAKRLCVGVPFFVGAVHILGADRYHSFWKPLAFSISLRLGRPSQNCIDQANTDRRNSTVI